MALQVDAPCVALAFIPQHWALLLLARTARLVPMGQVLAFLQQTIALCVALVPTVLALVLMQKALVQTVPLARMALGMAQPGVPSVPRGRILQLQDLQHAHRVPLVKQVL